MRNSKFMRNLLMFLVGAGVALSSLTAEAAPERKSPLAGAPAIRKRLELRDKRFEIGVGTGVTIGQDFYNALLIMPRLSFHFTDWIALGVFGGFNATPGWKSSFNSDLQPKLAEPESDGRSPDPKTPTAELADATMNRIGYLGGAQIEFLPLAGKLALFSNAFMYFDLYVFAGAAAVNLVSKGALPGACNGMPAEDPYYALLSCGAKVETGMKIAGNVGLGAHAFLTNYLALVLEIRDLLYKNNSAGRDVNGDRRVNSNDLKLTSNWLFSLNVQLFLPIKTKVSR